MAAETYIIIHEDCDLPAFKASEWIGTNRPYVNVPEEVSNAKNRCLEVPTSFSSQFPSPTLSVVDVLAFTLPEMSNGIVTSKTALWFSKDIPTTAPDCLWMRPVVSESYLKVLERDFGQAWLDGAQSMIDPRFNSGRDRLPLWMLGFWRKMVNIIRDRQQWKHSIQWLQSEKEKVQHNKDSDTLKAIDEALLALRDLPWNTSLTCWSTANTVTLLLSTFLGNKWLNDEHIDLMMEALTERVNRDPKLKKKIIIAPLALARELENNCNGTYNKKRGAAVLCRYEKHIKDNQLEQLYFPVHVNSNHWIAAYVDFSNGRIGYGQFTVNQQIQYLTVALLGDSLAHQSSPHRKFMLHLRLWLSTCFGLDPEDGIDSMRHGKQNDSFSCGPTSANTIAHGIFNDPLWTPATATIQRIRWFLCLSQASKHAKPPPVSPTPPIPAPVNMPGLETDIHLSILQATKDHNFADLVKFALADEDREPMPEIRTRHHLSILELLNPADPMFEDAETTYEEAGSEEMDIDDGDPESDCQAPSPAVKRKRTLHVNSAPSSKSGSSDSELTSDERTPKRPRPPKGTLGQSRSAVLSREKRVAFREGTFQADVTAVNTWKQAILADDPLASFDPVNLRSVHHSTCGKTFLVKEPLDLTRWRSHIKDCKEKKKKKTKAAGVISLFALGFGKVKTRSIAATSTPSPPTVSVTPPVTLARSAPVSRPCPGITEQDCPGIVQYLNRSSAIGGGGQAIHIISSQIFNKLFSQLRPQHKDDVLAAQSHTHLWRNDHRHLRIYSTTCKKKVDCRKPDRPLPCGDCKSVITLKSFKNVLNKKMPLPKNQIFTNAKYRNQVLGELYGQHIGLKEIIEAPVSLCSML